jgi:hypothetical protein
MKDYKVQDGCHNCAHCFYHHWSHDAGPDMYCEVFDPRKEQPWYAVLAPDISGDGTPLGLLSPYSKEWHEMVAANEQLLLWQKNHQVVREGICSLHQKSEEVSKE